MKAFETGGFCDLQEYRRSENERLPISSIDISELYMIMLAIKSQNPREQAARFPARVQNISPNEGGLHNLGVVILDADLKELDNTNAAFKPDGLWVSELNVATSKIKSAYFKTYEENIDWELLSLANSLQVVRVSELRKPLSQPQTRQRSS